MKDNRDKIVTAKKKATKQEGKAWKQGRKDKNKTQWETVQGGKAGSKMQPEALQGRKDKNKVKSETVQSGKAGSKMQPKALQGRKDKNKVKSETVQGGKAGSKMQPKVLQGWKDKNKVQSGRRKGDADVKTKNSGICPVAEKCGGCKWIDKEYEAQLKKKEKWVRELLTPFCKTEPIIGMKNPTHYRNKVHAVFGEDRKHNIISGIYEEGTHKIVPVDSCLIENEKADAIIVSIRELMKSFKIRPYNEDTGYGLLRHVLIRTAYMTGQIMVVLVLSSPVMPSKNNFVKALLKQHPEISTIVLNVNNRDTSMILGDKEQVIYGKGYIEDELCGKVFRISPKSFYQVNPEQTEHLYGKALEFAELRGTETILDAYCGTGTIGLIASDKAGKVIGVELNGDAVKDARENAKRNKVANIQFYQNDAGKFLVGMAEQNAKVDVVFMDPPRSGSDEAFLSSVLKMKPRKVIYISCNPETLARDLNYLTKNGYQVKRAVACDMFPFTSHVETVCLLSHKAPV